MDEARFTLVVVAFVRSVGGVVRVLLALDEGQEQRYDGEPVLLFEHRPGDPATAAVIEPAGALPSTVTAAVRDHASPCLVAIIEGAFDDAGTFHADRLVGATAQFVVLRDSLGP